MGTIRAQFDASGQTVNGVLLGDPVVWPEPDDPEHIWEWDDARLPEGELIPTGDILTADTDD